MNENLIGIIGRFPQQTVLVIGEAMLDSYLSGPADRLCREAPVPVVSITGREHVPGGAANTAVNLTSLGARTHFLSVIGKDPEADLLCRALESAGVSTEHLIRRGGRSTLAKQRVIAGSQMVVRFDQGATAPVPAEVEDQLIDRLRSLVPRVDAIVVSDYAYGILTPRVIAALGELQAGSPRLLVVDSKRLPAYRQVRVTAVKPNYEEAAQLLGLSRLEPGRDAGRATAVSRARQIENEGARILDLTGAELAVVTIDRDGALAFTRDGEPYRLYARPRPDSRAAGAGDTFVSALTLALASGAHTENAAELASAAAEIVVGKDGTSACFAAELVDYFSQDTKLITDAFQLVARLAAYRREERRVVFTNGCFDLLHRGHINYLNRAKALGDVLIVGVNSDHSVRRLKGPSRPINSLEDRVQILAALSCVDHIVPFDTDTPVELIRQIRPDIFVKGGDYTRQTLPEAPLVEKLGGEVRILPYLEDHSTTGIIERIREIYLGSSLPD